MQLKVEDDPETEGILLDLSEDGLDLLAAQPLRPAAAIQVKFCLPDGTEIDARGEIAWANPNGQAGRAFRGTSRDACGRLCKTGLRRMHPNLRRLIRNR